MEYRDLKKGIRSCLDSAAEDFFMVGYLLRKVSEGALFAEDGYKNIWDFAKGEYGLSASSTSRFMAINARFSIDGGEHMAEKYVGMGVSKLQEMLGLPDEELEKVTQETTVREIRAMKKKQEEPGSFFGLPKTDKEKHPYTYTPGCGDGKYTCSSCARPCGMRQEERYCRTAPLGNPFPCIQMGGEKRLDMEAGPFNGECQHLHPELAPVRAGDKEPEPCCLTCGHKTCFSRCDVAKKKDGDERRKERAELQKWQKEQQKRQKEAEAGRPEPSERDIKAFYEWHRIKPADNISADGLKKEYRNSGGGGGHGLKDYQGSARGVRINYKREITWVQLAKRLKEIQEAAKAAVKPQTKERDTIDGGFREVGDSEKQKPITTQEPEQETEAETIARDPEAEAGPDPEEYTRLDVDLLLDKYLRDLRKCQEAFSGEDCPPPIIKKHVILVDALELLLEKIDFEIEAEERTCGA